MREDGVGDEQGFPAWECGGRERWEGLAGTCVQVTMDV